jgi:hypothetical protein
MPFRKMHSGIMHLLPFLTCIKDTKRRKFLISNYFFSSPCQRQGELLPSLGIRRPLNPSKSDQKYFFSKVTISQINTNLYSVPKIIVLKIQLDLTTTNVDVKHMETIVSTEGSDN